MADRYSPVQLRRGDCREVLTGYPENYFHAVATDPPYGLRLLKRRWDYDVPHADTWRSILRVLRPGGYMVAFGGPRTYHRLVCAVEDAGFEVVTQINWLFASNSMPKSFWVDKLIRKAAARGRVDIPPDEWSGWGTALRPALEPIVLARKPTKLGVAENIARFGTGALNIDASRANGRFPSNLIHDGSGEVETAFAAFGVSKSRRSRRGAMVSNGHAGHVDRQQKTRADLATVRGIDDEGTPSRFYYCAKPGAAERKIGDVKNTHPTLKPIRLMEYLVKLITPPGGIVLDPFMGSGTTGVAARGLGFSFVGVEREAEYIALARARLGISRAVPCVGLDWTRLRIHPEAA